MTHLIVLALATFFIWDCLARPLLGSLCDLVGVPPAGASYLKSLTALGLAVSLYRWVPEPWLTPVAAASLAGTLVLLRHSRDRQNISTVIRGRARRGMPMPKP